ncbi:hypothetical protein K4B79_19485 [Streptomyces lincolnensis]|uniref:hypothetical protein n=1 Tax=Streptomyces lincolnensis TaxID=1915 RepID=UPI001E2A88A1|nr:hypothetical protein [Streptomyces lincolnensis]MCD7440395.1 hypothetical protein [Streptomyces lincolnensis]
MPGTVLLLAASPVGKGCLVDAASVLPVLAAVPPAVLSGTDTANVVELADPLEPQAVLTRLRAAATAPGPLTVYVTGQLLLDRRQHLPHLALARTTTATVRYTGFPWQWIREELRLRAPGTTTLFLDLHADAETWQWLRTHPLDCGRNTAVYGRVSPPPSSRRAVAVPSYMKAVATILRSGWRPPVEQLHQQAVSRLGNEAYGALLLSAPGSGVPGGMVSGVPVAVPGGAAPSLPYRTEGPRPRTPDGLKEAAAPTRTPTSPRPTEAPLRAGKADPLTTGTPLPPEPDDSPLPEPSGPLPPEVSEPLPPEPRELQLPDPSVPSSPEPTTPHSPQTPAPRDPHDDDPHTYITAAVQDGRHRDADALAAEHERAAVRAHGVGSEKALHWAEVRADLAMFAGDSVRSCRTWLAVADARLTSGQAADSPAVEAAVDRAHHQWGQIRDVGSARELGAVLAELRGRVPGRREGALDAVRRQLSELLQTQG